MGSAVLLFLASQVVVSPDAVPTITEALRVVPRGGTITVTAGTYREPTLVADRPVTIVGQGMPVLDGEGARPLLVITGDSVTVRGLVFRNVGTSFVDDRAAIRVEEARDCVIAQNRIEEGFFGIYLASAAGCLIEDNVLRGATAREATSGNGIHLWYSKDVTVRRNLIERHRDGIYFEFVEDSRVEQNTSRDNYRYGLHFMFSDRCAYLGNEFRRNGAGVAVMYTEGVVMRDNAFLENWGSGAFGLLLKDITDSDLRGNTFRGNTVALFAEGTRRLEVTGNRFERNGWAVKLMANAERNRFVGNEFVGNTFDVATNSRRTAGEFRGNYWDAYRGYDLDHDGVGDVPHRPVRLFSLVSEQHPATLVLLRSLFVDVLDAAERAVPALTPDALTDPAPRMARRLP